MGQVIDMEEARKRLRPEEEDDCILLFDELTIDLPVIAKAIEAMLKTREEEFIAMWYNLPTDDMDDKQ